MSRGRKTKSGLIVLAAVLLVWLAALTPGFAGGRDETGAGTPGQVKAGGQRIRVFVSIPPQAYLVERIGGERVQVEVLVKPGQSPHTFEPTPQQMASLAEAEVFFRIGVEFENTLMPRIESTMERLEVVDCREGVRLRRMEEHGHDEHREEGDDTGTPEEDAHQAGEEQEGTDPHIWLSVRNAIRIAGTMREALVRLDPAGSDAYDRGLGELVDDLEALDRRITEILAPVAGKPFFVFHPSFGYFADDYGLEQIAVETGGTEPSARQLAGLIEEARERGVRVIFVQPQFSRVSAETVAAEIGGAVVPIDPLARDYIKNLELMARAVEEGLR
jgi:zinc transport system substrate-binding protein